MNLNQLFRNVAFLSGVSGMMVLNANAQQQVYPYFVDFERDSIKAYASVDPVLLNGINWVMPGVFLGEMVQSDKYHGLRAARVRLTDNTTGTPGSLTMEEDLAKGISEVSFYHGMYGSEKGGVLGVYYSTDQGQNWTQAGSDITPSIDTFAQATVSIDVSSPVRISIRKKDTAAAARINIDDILIKGYDGYETNVILTGRSPLGRSVELNTTELNLTFNEDVNVGTGNIKLHNTTDNTDQTIDVTSSSVVVTGKKVKVSGITLASKKDYYITFDSTAFVKAGSTLKSTGIYKENVWMFSTVDTSTLPELTALNETFTDCDEVRMGVFRNFSVTGNASWRCGNRGYTDDASVYMNGGFAGGANDNEDWLITGAKVNIGAMNSPVLEFMTQTQYTGTTVKEVYVSTNYAGAGTPADATWTKIYELSESPTDWMKIDGINLNDHKATPFYLAFKYVSSSANSGAESWTLDDIVIREGAGNNVTAIHENGFGIKVLGTVTTGKIALEVLLKEQTVAHLGIYDMTGRVMYTSDLNLNVGNNKLEIAGLNLSAGMYFVRVAGGPNSGTVRFVVK